MGNLFFKSAETYICSHALWVYWLQNKILSSIISKHFLFFLYYDIVQICPSREEGFITINYYIQESNILL